MVFMIVVNALLSRLSILLPRSGYPLLFPHMWLPGCPSFSPIHANASEDAEIWAQLSLLEGASKAGKRDLRRASGGTWGVESLRSYLWGSLHMFFLVRSFVTAFFTTDGLASVSICPSVGGHLRYSCDGSMLRRKISPNCVPRWSLWMPQQSLLAHFWQIWCIRKRNVRIAAFQEVCDHQVPDAGSTWVEWGTLGAIQYRISNSHPHRPGKWMADLQLSPWIPPNALQLEMEKNKLQETGARRRHRQATGSLAKRYPGSNKLCTC